MEKKKLLLVFIHGFKGDETTFHAFPTHLSALISLALPHLTVEAQVYPPFDTRGDLAATVRRFTDWLTTTVIDLEVARGTKNPMVEEGVRVVIAGHSMGGFVGAECLLGLLSETINSVSGESNPAEKEVKMGKQDARRRMQDEETKADERDDITQARGPHTFPYVQGLLAFDTPYLGISPGVVAHGAEGHWNTGKAWYEGATGLFASVQEMRGKSKEAPQKEKPNEPVPSSSLQTPPETGKPSKGAAWGKYALYGLGASALGLTTAYLARSTLSSGYEWATSHLEFIGCLGRPEELRKRFSAVAALSSQHDTANRPFIGFANFYSLLGAAATPASPQPQASSESKLPFNLPAFGTNTNPRRNEWSEDILGPERTFCNVPKQGRAAVTKRTEAQKNVGEHRSQPEKVNTPAEGIWHAQLNDLATDEVTAHCTMFDPENNLGFYTMAEEARDLVVDWMKRGGWG